MEELEKKLGQVWERVTAAAKEEEKPEQKGAPNEPLPEKRTLAVRFLPSF